MGLLLCSCSDASQGGHPVRDDVRAPVTSSPAASATGSPAERGDADEIEQHVAILAYHAVSGDFKQVSRRFATLAHELVPPRGPAATVQGEVLRAVDRLASESRRNGNMNWGSYYEALVDFLERTLTSEGALPEEQRRAVAAHLDIVRRLGRGDVDAGDERTVFGHLVVAAVAFCEAHPEPVPLSR